MKKEITAEIARELIDYDPKTGALTWKKRDRSCFQSDWMYHDWNARWSGKPTLDTDKRGYKRGKLFGGAYVAHRVAWLIAHGSWPAGLIDHINGDRADNRLENLRVVDARENTRNAARPKHNTSGVTGVYKHTHSPKWVATIKVDGRARYLGFFTDFDQAVAARKEAERLHGFHENHGRAPLALGHEFL